MEQRLLLGVGGVGLVGVTAGRIQNTLVTGLLDVGASGKHQPQVVIIEVAANICIALLGEGLILMEAGAVRKLSSGDVQDALAGAAVDHVDEAQQILVGIAEAHAAANARLVHGGRAAHVEGGHALVLVPGVGHAGGVRIGALDLEVREVLVPVSLEAGEGVLDSTGLLVLRQDFLAGGLVDHSGSHEALALEADQVMVHIGQDESEGLALPRLQGQAHFMGADRVPAKGDAVGSLASKGHLGLVKTFVNAHEGVARRIKAADLAGAGKQRVMVAALAVLGLVVDGRALNLHLTDAVGALVVGHVVEGLEKAELLVGVDLRRLLDLGLVGDGDLPELEVLARRNAHLLHDFQSILLAQDGAVAQAVAALVLVELGLDRLPARVPDGAAIVHVEVTTAHVVGHVVVAVAGQTTKLGVLPEGVAAGCVGAETEELILAEVVEPRQRSIGTGDDIFARRVFKVPVGIHAASLCQDEGDSVREVRLLCGTSTKTGNVLKNLEFRTTRRRHFAGLFFTYPHPPAHIGGATNAWRAASPTSPRPPTVATPLLLNAGEGATPT